MLPRTTLFTELCGKNLPIRLTQSARDGATLSIAFCRYSGSTIFMDPPSSSPFVLRPSIDTKPITAWWYLILSIARDLEISIRPLIPDRNPPSTCPAHRFKNMIGSRRLNLRNHRHQFAQPTFGPPPFREP